MNTKSFALSLALLVPFVAGANEEIEKLTADSNNWAIWGGNYAGTRYSELTQIDKSNVGRLQPVWTFSTGVLRGHEGGPLVIGGPGDRQDRRSVIEREQSAGAEEPRRLRNRPVRVGERHRSVVTEDDIEGCVGEWHALGTRVDQREVDAGRRHQRSCMGQLSV